MTRQAYPKQYGASAARRKKPIDYEGREQTQLINWIKGECRRGNLPAEVELLIYAVPNGGSRHKLEAAKMRAQGVRAGVSDLVLPMPRGGYHGMYLEFKATPPRDAPIAESQRDWALMVRQQGYLSLVIKGIEEAKRVIKMYVSMDRTVVMDTSALGDRPNHDQFMEVSAC